MDAKLNPASAGSPGGSGIHSKLFRQWSLHSLPKCCDHVFKRSAVLLRAQSGVPNSRLLRLPVKLGVMGYYICFITLVLGSLGGLALSLMCKPPAREPYLSSSKVWHF